MGTMVTHSDTPKGLRSHIRLALQAMSGMTVVLISGLMFLSGFAVTAFSFQQSISRGIGSRRPMVLAVAAILLSCLLFLPAVVGFLF
jgi:hypothetical protein